MVDPERQGPDTVRELVEARRSKYQGVIDGEVDLHRWGRRITPGQPPKVVHEVVVEHGAELNSPEEHLNAAREVAGMLEPGTSGLVGYLGTMSPAEAATALSNMFVAEN